MLEALKEIIRPELLAAPLLALPFLLLILGLVGTQQRQRRSLLAEGMVRCMGSTPWRSVQGHELWYYVVFDEFMSVPKFAELFSEWFQSVILRAEKDYGKIHKLVFMEKTAGPVGAITAKDLLTVKTHIPSIALRPRRRITVGRICGLNLKKRESLAGRRVVIVGDVATTGDTMAEVVHELQGQGAQVPLAVVFYDREEGAQEMLGKLHVGLRAMVKRSEQSEWPELNEMLEQQKRALAS